MGGSFRGAQSGDEGGFGGFVGGFWVFATRRWMVVFPGFLGCLVWSGLRWWLGWCKLFPCCRSARVAPLGWFGLAERWWFENSRGVFVLLCRVILIASPIPAPLLGVAEGPVMGVGVLCGSFSL